MPIDPVSKPAVVFSGGGAYGAYEVGILKALTDGSSPATAQRPLMPEVVTGTSVGAFNAALLAMYAKDGTSTAAKRMEEVWMNDVAETASRENGVYRVRGNPLRYLDPGAFREPAELFRAMSDAFYLSQDWSMRLLRFAAGRGSFAQRTSDLLDISSFLSVEPFARLLEKTLDAEAIAESSVSASIVATNWQTGAIKVFTNREINAEHGPSIVMASAAIPGIFQPVKVDAEDYVDGGVVLNTPLSTALNAGATELHVVYMSPDVRNIPTGDLQATLDVFDRVYHIMLATKIAEDITTARWINEGLAVLERYGAADVRDVSLEAERSFIRVASVIHNRIEAGRPYRPVTIHRYFPKRELGGALAMLNFEAGSLRAMMEMGVTDARTHDCAAAGCVVPARAARAASRK